MRKRKVVITGAGVCTTAGNDRELLWASLLENKSFLMPVQNFSPAPFPPHPVAEIKSIKEPPGIDRAFFLLMNACKSALEEANLSPDYLARKCTGFSMGTSLGGMSTVLEHWNGKQTVNISQGTYIGTAYTASKSLKCTGPTLCFNIACASGGQAIGASIDLIQSGKTDIMIASGVDILNPFVFKGFASLRAMAHVRVSPFDVERDGMGLGEGAGAIILENEIEAKKRGASIICEARSVGLSLDGVHISAPDREGKGLARAIKSCLDQGQTSPLEIAYINAHGTATKYNDAMEAKAIRLALGEQCTKIPLSSVKGAIGHTLGAAGVIEAIVSIMALEKGIAPPTCNLENPDPECPLNHIIKYPVQIKGDAVLSLNAGFGGQNVAVLLKK